MKKKVALCFLVFALILTCANAMAAKIGGANAEGGSGATIVKESDQTVKVTYAGQKDKEYVVMAVAQSGIDSSAGRPTKETIGNNQSGVVVYMDQAKGKSDGTVDFVIHPNLEKAKTGDEYSIYISSNVANSAMTKIGSFTIEELLAMFGDVNGDGAVDDLDEMVLARYNAGWDDYGPGLLFNVVEENADVNRDKGVDDLDEMILSRFNAGWDGYALPYES